MNGAESKGALGQKHALWNQPPEVRPHVFAIQGDAGGRYANLQRAAVGNLYVLYAVARHLAFEDMNVFVPRAVFAAAAEGGDRNTEELSADSNLLRDLQGGAGQWGPILVDDFKGDVHGVD